MKVKIEMKRMGGGYLKAIYGQTRNNEAKTWEISSVFGATEEELLNRLKSRLNTDRNYLKKSMK